MKIVIKKRKVKKVKLSTLVPKDTFKYKSGGDNFYSNFMVLDTTNPNLEVYTKQGDSVDGSENILVAFFGNGSIGYIQQDTPVIKTESELTING